MTNNTDPVRALRLMVEKLAAHVRPTCGELWNEAQAALASAPPSAPEPEVHSYDPTDQRQSVTIRWPDGKCLGYVLDRTRYTDNLPPSAPVGVEWVLELADEYDAKGQHDRAYDLRSLSRQPAACVGCEGKPAPENSPCAVCGQQPAAVDGACAAAAAAVRFALTDPEGMTFLRLWNEGEFNTLRREWPDAPSEIYVGADSLAAQQQEVPRG